jgi:carbon-monoxide dehydrogenase catalytic subunit
MPEGSHKFQELTTVSDAQAMLEVAARSGIETVWDRYKAQLPQCGYCDLGLSCRNCVMGPCRIDPFGEGPQKGVCGADGDIIVTRNLCRMIAAGAASHSDHGRDLVEVLLNVGEGRAPGYGIRDVEKLKRVAQEFGISPDGKTPEELAKALAYAMQEEYGTRKSSLQLVSRVPLKRKEIWERLNILPRGIDRETSEMMHRTHMGVDNNWQTLLLQGARCALADGWGGSLIATEVSDIIFGVPTPKPSKVNLGVLKQEEVNILVHGHNPVVSEMVSAAVQDPEMLELAKRVGAKGINLAGLCCTGNELMMRKGIPMAGNHLMTELVIMTGAVEMIIVDYQCIMPSLGPIAKCFHTKMISTSDKARFPDMQHVEFHPHDAAKKAKDLVREAVLNYQNRIKERVVIPVSPTQCWTGFSVEALLQALGGSLDPLIETIKAGKIRGAVGVVGCNNPKIRHDYGHVTLTKRLIENDILVLDTGCAAVANAKAGLKTLEAQELAGKGLREVAKALNIPPVLHVGSCVDNTRIIVLAAHLANALGVDISDLPLAGAAPEWYSEKAVTIAVYVVASGITTVLGTVPPVLGSRNLTKMLLGDIEGLVGARFHVEPDPEKAAKIIIAHIEEKRKALGLEAKIL